MTDDDRPRGSCLIDGCSRDPYPREDGRLPLVCGPHVSQLGQMFREVPGMVAELDRQLMDAAMPDMRGKDISLLLPSVVLGSPGRGGRVSGTAERRIPINADRTDLLDRARLEPLSVEGRWAAAAGDQVGRVSVATALALIADDWLEARGDGERWPARDVRSLCVWLHRRCYDACDRYEAVADAYRVVRDIHSALRRLLGMAEPRKQELVGVPCSSCEVRLLVRLPGSSYVECEACGHLLTEEEYAAWCKALVARPRKSVTPRT